MSSSSSNGSNGGGGGGGQRQSQQQQQQQRRSGSNNRPPLSPPASPGYEVTAAMSASVGAGGRVGGLGMDSPPNSPMSASASNAAVGAGIATLADLNVASFDSADGRGALYDAAAASASAQAKASINMRGRASSIGPARTSRAVTPQHRNAAPGAPLAAAGTAGLVAGGSGSPSVHRRVDNSSLSSTAAGGTTSSVGPATPVVARSSAMNYPQQRTHRRINSPPSASASASYSTLPPTHPQSVPAPPASSSSRSASGGSSTRRTAKFQQAQQQQQQQSPQKQSHKDRSFQQPSDSMRVTIRTIDLSNRCAFERIHPPPPSDLRALAEQHQQQQQLLQDSVSVSSATSCYSASSSTGIFSRKVGKKRSKEKKLSPAVRHVEVLERLHSISVIRQLSWSPGVSPQVDPFVSWDDYCGVTADDEMDDRLGTGSVGDYNGNYKSDDDTSLTDGSMTSTSTSRRGGDGGSTNRTIKHKRKSNNRKKKSRTKRKLDLAKRRKQTVRDGRTKIIDPISATMSCLPRRGLPPPLSNRRYRLPMRSDVGFPNPTEDEIRLKQEEIAREAELEEASPRLIVMITSEDVVGTDGGVSSRGSDTANKEVSTRREEQEEEDTLRRLWDDVSGGIGTECGVSCNNRGVGLCGMPLAGRELVAAWYRNSRLYSKGTGGLGLQRSSSSSSFNCGSGGGDDDIGGGTSGISKKCRPKPNRFSVFAPPIDASFSSTIGWRPRPFSDRPAGMVYLIASPIDIRFDVGDIEPLVCTMGLYCLTPQHQIFSLSQPGGGKLFRGKISEDFVFPAGDWKGLMHEEAAKVLAGLMEGNASEYDSEGQEEKETGDDDDMSEAGTEQRWRRRKRKALFSYDPLALPPPSGGGGLAEAARQYLHIVVQVHKVTQGNAAGPYLGQGGSAAGAVGLATESGGSTSSTRKKKLGSRIMKKFGKSSKSGFVLDTASSVSVSGSSHRDNPLSINTQSSSKALTVYDTFGTQFLTPLCFGVLPVFPPTDSNGESRPLVEDDDVMEDDAMLWPNGSVQNMQLYSFPPSPETQEQFVERLSELAAEQRRQPQLELPTVTEVPEYGGLGSSHVIMETSDYDPVHELAIGHSMSFPPASSSEDSSLKTPSPSRKARSRSVTRFSPGRSTSKMQSTAAPRIGTPAMSPFTPMKRMDRLQTVAGNVPVSGRASFFTSVLGVDFAQAMLQMPPALTISNLADTIALPRLLVDVSGDCAIMMNPDYIANIRAPTQMEGGPRKRSNLVRLPPSTKPSAYADSAEVREVLYLPPRAEKQYDSDVPVTARTLLNVLYLYPHLIKLKAEGEKKGSVSGWKGNVRNRHFSIRVRLVQQSIDIDEDTGQMATIYTPLEALHNPAPWGGRPMIKALYTKVSQNTTAAAGKGGSRMPLGGIEGEGIPMRDEMKLRLPVVLDGSHFIEFSLVALDLSDDFGTRSDGGYSPGILTEVLANAMIPLSSSSTREKHSGVRVTTVIPNGTHRIKLGDFQLHVETRLASSIHVSDPAVAAVLREFPYAKDAGEGLQGSEDGNGMADLALVRSRSTASSVGSSPLTENRVPFYTILTEASEHEIVNHFQALVFMHMCNLVNCGAPELDLAHVSKVFNCESYGAVDTGSTFLEPGPSRSTLLLMENIRSLFEIVRKVKLKFSSFGLSVTARQIEHFLKVFMDNFDESSLSLQPRMLHIQHDTGGDSSVELSSSSFGNVTPASSTLSEKQVEPLTDLALDALEEKLLETAVHVVVQQEYANSSVMIENENNGFALRGPSGVSPRRAPFSRTAFGASKTDRMRAEAELYQYGARFTEMFDDDETVMTTDTGLSSYDERPPIGSVLGGPAETAASGTTGGPNQWGIAEDDTNFDDDLTQTSAFDSVRSSIHEESKNSFDGPSTPFSFASERAKSMARSLGDNGLAKRVNTVAQVVIAPCMAPSLSTVLATGNGSSPTKAKIVNASLSERELSERRGFGEENDSGVSIVENSNNEESQKGGVCKVFSDPCVGPSNVADTSFGRMRSSLFVCCSRERENQHHVTRANEISIALTDRSTKSSPFVASIERSQPHDYPRNLFEPQDESKKGVCSPGSDIEEEDQVQPFVTPNPGAWTPPKGSKLRAYQRIMATEQLEFTPSTVGEIDGVGEDGSDKERPFLYETIFALWLQAWLPHADLLVNGQKSSTRRKTSETTTWSTVFQHSDPSLPQADVSHAFTAHADFLLPICLKSLALRCTLSNTRHLTVPASVLDKKHMLVLEPIIELLARGLMGQALAGGISQHEADESLVRALHSSEAVLDFLVGLLAIIHPAQVSILINKYFVALRDCEEDEAFHRSSSSGNEHLSSSSNLVWTQKSLRLVRCSRQLRLRAVEKISDVPMFVALNFPLKYESRGRRRTCQPPSWKNQSLDGQLDSLDDVLLASPYPDGLERLPPAHWLASLLANESLTICASSCEAVVAEAVAQIKASQEDSSGRKGVKESNLKNRSGIPLTRNDLLRFQSTAMHAVTCVYELLLRRHSMDVRFQTEECRGRVAAIFASSIIDNSVSCVKWLARMESTHKVRTLWLLCLIYILQEAPESALRAHLHSFCVPEDFLIHKFIRLLRLSSSTFQCFIDQKHNSSSSLIMQGLSPWLVQESFNTICAATNMLVDECADIMSLLPHEQKKMAQGVLDVLLHVITTPQSSVTHLRALGGASQALDKFGVSLFLEVVGDSLQHWARVILTLMNSISLSVRSIAVDFTVSLLGGAFGEGGNIDEISLVFLSVMPEVVAREIGLYSVSGQIETMTDVESALWPLRRALADVEEANPVDDDRVDAQLAPFIGIFCRACQAVIDGVIIELRLKGDQCVIVGARVKQMLDGVDQGEASYTFDADEESLFEAAMFFLPESGPLQRVRWLLTLKSLHESKGQWVEAAETLILCAKTIADSIPHLKSVWRPSRFVLWHDSKRSLWLSSIGEDLGIPGRGNSQVMEFADNFLEPPNLFGGVSRRPVAGKLHQPTVAVMCKMLVSVSKEAVEKYLEEDGMEGLAFSRLQKLLKVVMDVVENHNAGAMPFGAGNALYVTGNKGRGGRPSRTRLVEENAALRKMSASLNGDMTRLAERMLLLAEEKSEDENVTSSDSERERTAAEEQTRRQYYVRVQLLGRKPNRFKESTTIPTFLEWESPSICRVRREAVLAALGLEDRVKVATDRIHTLTDYGLTVEERVCAAYAKPILDSLAIDLPEESLVLIPEPPTESTLKQEGNEKTFLVVSLVHMDASGLLNKQDNEMGRGSANLGESKRFFLRKVKPSSSPFSGLTSSLVELTVAQPFPCALSRQRTLFTSEFYAGGA